MDSRESRRRYVVAPQVRLVQVEDLAPRFFREVFKLEDGDFAWTDESALGDFDLSSSYEEIYRRIEAAYGCDVRDVSPPSVVDVLLAIRDRAAAP